MSLVPSATELLYALGLSGSVVAVTHECDHPPAAAGLPHLTRSVIPAGLSAAGIDAAVRRRAERGEALYELDAELLSELRPDLIVTQALCEVCAVSVDDVRAVAGELPSRPRVVSLDPSTLADVLGNARSLAGLTGAERSAERLLNDADERIDRVKRAVDGAERPRVAALEWLDPPFAGGHWVPELIELAGGEDPLGASGQRSRTVSWDELRDARPDAVVCMPCGYDADRSAEEAREHAPRLAGLGAREVVAVDAAAYFSRPGPRLVEGLELLAHLLHPDRVAASPPGRVVRVDVEAAGAVR